MNPVPVMTTEVPTGPLVGLNDEIVGAAACATGTTISATTCSARTTSAVRAVRRRARMTSCIERAPFAAYLPAILPPTVWKVLEHNPMQS